MTVYSSLGLSLGLNHSLSNTGITGMYLHQQQESERRDLVWGIAHMCSQSLSLPRPWSNHAYHHQTQLLKCGVGVLFSCQSCSRLSLTIGSRD